MPGFGEGAGEPPENGEKAPDVRLEIFRRFALFPEDASKTDKTLKEKTQEILR